MTKIDCEPSLYFVISGPGMADSSMWPCGIMQVGEWGETRTKRAPLLQLFTVACKGHSIS